MSAMTYSKTGEALTERFEGCSLTAYQDIGGVWTIGFGHTGDDVFDGLVWTQAQADAQLAVDTESAVNCVNAQVTVTLTQPEFDSLCDFAYNVGCGAFTSSTLLALLNQSQFVLAAREFDRWDYAGGKQVAGLLRRRQAETSEFKA
jgi:lysozyme